MAISNNVTATFSAISNEAINASGETLLLDSLGKDLNKYFDLLIQVKWLSGPKEGQEGWLLCSHYCKWPQELLNKAEFIEGCFTPQQYEEDPRLVLGYHAGSVTSYTWAVPGEVVEISTSPYYYQGEESATFQRSGEVYLPTCRSFRLAHRLASRFIRDAIQEGLTAAQGFSALEQRWVNGEIPLGIEGFLFSYMLIALSIEDLEPNQRLSMELLEYQDCCEVNGDLIRVVGNRGEFQFPSNLPYTMEEGYLKVEWPSQEAEEAGWVEAVPNPSFKVWVELVVVKPIATWVRDGEWLIHSSLGLCLIVKEVGKVAKVLLEDNSEKLLDMTKLATY